MRDVWGQGSTIFVSNSYLDIAEEILRNARQPMSPREILAQAYVQHKVPQHLRGKTQEKTLQARLSEDISRLRERSLFFRTNRARFFLREFLTAPSIPSAFKNEYLARPRRKDLRNERILVFDHVEGESEKSRFMSTLDLDQVFECQTYRYATWPEVDARAGVVPVFSFVIFHTDEEVLTHFAGQFNDDSHPSKGFRSIGFGSAVRAQDGDLLYDAYHGIIGSAINELVYSLGISREAAREARYENKVRLRCAIVESDERLGRHIRAVMSYRCPEDFFVSKASLSLNRLVWMSPNGESSLSEFDEASQMLLRSDILTKLLHAL